MNYEQLVLEIFDDYDKKHRAILGDVLATSEMHADRILAKYNTKKLSAEQVENLKKLIVQKEVDEFMLFVEQHKDVLDSTLSDQQKFAQIFARMDSPELSQDDREYLKKRIRRNIYDNEVSKILLDLAKKLKL
ncbi:MAG: hypothetical protein IJD18_00965 [Clostridia bacterium]|nr:hypothetical protein [Clostridia bacterium]MBQ3066574.1 hypothetical protein [Clostridia bacterium]